MITTCTSSSDKILQAATELFASNNFDGTSIKDISKLSGVNSALISYYFGGKKNLYQEVLNNQSALFLDLIEQVNKQLLSPIEKLHLYTKEVSLIQMQRPMQVHLIYRELLTPTGFCNNFVQSKLYKIHKFLFDLVTAGIEEGSIKSSIQPTYVAFTIESIIVFFFLTQNFVRELGSFSKDDENEYLENALNSYLDSMTI
ncbi:MAG: TetR family transcriptional regulator [Acidaminococcaceae bacterium]